jgi:hypothetical protein
MLYKTNAYIVPMQQRCRIKLGHLNNSTSALVLQASQLLIELGKVIGTLSIMDVSQKTFTLQLKNNFSIDY